MDLGSEALFIDKLEGGTSLNSETMADRVEEMLAVSFYYELETFLVELVFLKTKVMITLETRGS